MLYDSSLEISVALRAKVDSVRANPDKRASKGEHSRPCGPGGGRSGAEADGRPAGAGSPRSPTSRRTLILAALKNIIDSSLTVSALH